MEKLFEKLQYAKEAVRTELENAATLVDMHGLKYWAGEVERLRDEVKKSL